MKRSRGDYDQIERTLPKKQRARERERERWCFERRTREKERKMQSGVRLERERGVSRIAGEKQTGA